MLDFPQFVLADFDNPPVVETVLSLQFEKLNSMQSVHLGLFWGKMRDRYPKTEERPALPPVIERFPEPLARPGRIQFEAVETAAPLRLWLLNNDETEIVQVQNDRFITNWRKTGVSRYPHYQPMIKPAFERDLREFQSFLAEEKLGTIRVNQCEVTYVNHIVSGEGWQRFGDIDRIFKFWKQETPIPGLPEDLNLHIRFPITDEQHHPIGRLHVDLQPAFRATDKRPMYVLNLTARGQYGDDFAFFDIGRKWIVKSFEELTSENMHQIWRKK